MKRFASEAKKNIIQSGSRAFSSSLIRRRFNPLNASLSHRPPTIDNVSGNMLDFVLPLAAGVIVAHQIWKNNKEVARNEEAYIAGFEQLKIFSKKDDAIPLMDIFKVHNIAPYETNQGSARLWIVEQIDRIRNNAIEDREKFNFAKLGQNQQIFVKSIEQLFPDMRGATLNNGFYLKALERLSNTILQANEAYIAEEDRYVPSSLRRGS